MNTTEKKAILKINEIKKSFDTNLILNKVSLKIHSGEVIVILGPSGCGKSTLLRCINGLENIQSGTIELDGTVITSPSTNWSKVRQKIGMVFQNYDLFPHMTVIENCILAPSKVQKKKKEEIIHQASSLLERVGLSGKENAYPRQLSGGQKQRVAIVRSLLMEPEIMLFDEVTAALDPEMVREVLDVILELAKTGNTMLIVTHEMQFARAVADRIIFMDEGKIIETAPPEQFFTNPQTSRAKQFLNIFSFT